VRAERKLGEERAKLPKAKGRAGPGRGKAGAEAGRAFTDAATNAELGLSKKESARRQQLAAMPDREAPRALKSKGAARRPPCNQKHDGAGLTKGGHVGAPMPPFDVPPLWDQGAPIAVTQPLRLRVEALVQGRLSRW
jgi:hypothetical protein